MNCAPTWMWARGGTPTRARVRDGRGAIHRALVSKQRASVGLAPVLRVQDKCDQLRLETAMPY